MNVQSIRVAYVEFIPSTLDDGVLYVSRKYRTASHRCCCGCGTKIVTPLRETEHELIERDGSVSLHPSIGNWNHPCQSHYWIRDNHIVWAGPMSKAAIQSGRAYDDAVKAEYFSKAVWPWWRRAWSRIRGWLP